MGVDDYLLTSTVQALVGQRLVRTLCTECRHSHDAAPDLIERLGLERLTDARPIVLWEAAGCSACAGTGFHGRTSILEVLVLSDAIR
jgi:general secretion pathway protein E